jgi:hypothetical protein
MSSRIKGIIDAVSDLAMDYQARMARANDIDIDTRAQKYHGTNNLEGFEQFDPLMTGKGADQYGPGFYLSTSPNQASGFADGMFRGRGLPAPDSPGVLPLYSRTNNLMEVDGRSANHLGDVLNLKESQVRGMLDQSSALKRSVDNEDMNPLGDYYESFWSEGADDWMLDDLAAQYAGRNPEELTDLFADNGEFLAALSDATGFDGLNVKFSDDLANEIHWKPENIRSTSAQFDPTKKDSANLLAGVTGAGLLGGSMFASEDADAGAITKAAKESMLKFFNEAAVDNAIKQAGSRKSREALTQMSIDDFLSLARDGYDPTKSAGILDVSKFDDLPFLNIRSENGIANITGHEGRHRARRLKELGETTMPVRIKSDIRWDQQNDPKLWDYEQDYPQILFNEDGTKKSPFPFVQGDSNLLDSSALNIEDIQRKTTPTAKQIDDDELLKGLFGGSAATAVGAGTVLAPQDAQASNQPVSKGLMESLGDTALETMSGVNRAAADGVNFLTSDQINAILNLSGSDKRIPDLYDIPGVESGTKGNYMEPGLLRQIVRQGSEFLSPI